MLRDIDENGSVRAMDDIDYRQRFDSKWSEFTPEEQRVIDAEINRVYQRGSGGNYQSSTK
jgi:hypothetical protein